MSTQISTFISAFEEYKVYAQKRRKEQGYTTHIRNLTLHILPFFKDVQDMRCITKKDIVLWQNKILDLHYSNSYNNSLYYDFSSFINYCITFDYMEENIVLSVEKFPRQIEKKDHEVYNLFEFRRFRFHLDNFIDKQFFNFIFFCGTRPSETMALRFKDIIKNKVNICSNIQRKGKRKLDTTKNLSSTRTFRINFLVRFRIWKLKRYYIKLYGSFSDDYFVFGGKKPLAPTTIDRHKKIACKKANIKEITQHEFRHSYATRMIHKGVSIDVVSRNMGHSKVSTTVDIYLHEEKRIPSIPFLRLFL